jgi:hypothetical protein
MERKISCNKCCNLNSILKIQDESKYEDIEESLCPDCKLVIASFYNEADTNILNLVGKSFVLPKNSIFYHLNESCLSTQNAADLNDYSDKCVLIVGFGELNRLSVLSSIAKLEFKKMVCLSNTIGWALDFFDDMILAEHQDIDKKEDTLEIVNEYMLENKLRFDAVLTYDESSLLIASYLATNLNLPSIPFDFALKMANAYEFKKACLEADLKMPHFCIIKSNDRLNVLKEVKNRLNTLRSEINGKVIGFPLLVRSSNSPEKCIQI